jgi:hypothetical protein
MLQLINSKQPVLIPETKALITERIRGEFREMPGLTLTAAQACRLWNLDMPACADALSHLVDSGYLCRKADGAYGRATDLTVHPRMANVGLQFLKIDRPKRHQDRSP